MSASIATWIAATSAIQSTPAALLGQGHCQASVRTSRAATICSKDNVQSGGKSSPRVEIAAAGSKGQGVFAAEHIARGRWVCEYEGELVRAPPEHQQDQPLFDPLGLLASGSGEDGRGLTDREEADIPILDSSSLYLLEVAPDLFLDAQHSSHFSRFFNHEQRGNLDYVVRSEERRVDFYAARDIAVGTELTFDYGAAYWFAAGSGETDGGSSNARPADGTDSRTFTIDADDPFRSWCAAESENEDEQRGEA